MKKILCFILIAVLSLGVLTSCEQIGGAWDSVSGTVGGVWDSVSGTVGGFIDGIMGNEQPAGPTLEEAVSFLHNIYKDKSEITRADFDVVGKVIVNGVSFPVTWESDNDAVTVRPSTKTGYYTVDLPDENGAEFSYVLTATVADAEGNTATKSYTFTVPVINNSGITTTPVAGVAYKLFLLQGSFNQRYYALNTTQDNKNKFINTTLDPKASADFYVEVVDGGYKVYTEVDGVKNYIYVNVEKTVDEATGTVKYSKYIGFSTENASVLSYNEKMGGTWTTVVHDLVWGIGTYNTYTTISVSEGTYFTPEKVGDSQFVMQFITADVANTYEPDELPEAPSEAKDILEKLYALADGESAAGEFKLTGVITALDNYNNPTIVVEGYENMPVYCYRLTDDRFVVGATISVTALQMKNYGGTYEFMSCTLDSITLPGEGGDSTEMTIPEVLAAAEGTEVKVTGTVESFYYAWDDSYGNCSVYIVDDAGNKLLCFRLKTKVEIGDNITVTGVVAVYNGTNQLAQGCTAVINSSGNTGTNPETPSTLEVVTSPEVGVAYKFGLVHGGYGSVSVYFNGQNYNNYAWYLAYTENTADAVDVYLEAVEGVENAYRLFFYNGEAKTYIVAFPRDGDTTKGTLKLDTATPTEYFTFDTTHNTLIYTSVTGEQFYLGSSGTYKSISCSAISYIESDTSYVAHLYAAGNGEGGDTPVDPDPEEPVNPDPETPVVPEDGIYTIPQVLAAAEGTQVIVKGTVVEIYQAWNPQYNNVSFYIADAEGNRLLVFRTGTNANIGDQVTVTGTATLYNSVIQIAQGGTTVIDVAHVCSDFTAADCLNAPKCTVCGKENGEALGHKYENGVCGACGAVEVTGTTTASKNVADLITELGWTSSTTKQSFTLDDNVTVKVDGGNNSGKAYNGDHIRIYATDSPAGTLTISVAEGYELVSVKVTTATGTYAFLCVDGSDADISNETVAVSGSSVVLNSVKNGSDGKQVRVMAIEVVYKSAN